ncbi:MAG: hypothetical protein ACYDFT_08075 [Thermoplasmata archaeon]
MTPMNRKSEKQAQRWGSVVVIGVAAAIAIVALWGGTGDLFHSPSPGPGVPGSGVPGSGGRSTEGGNGLEATPVSWQMTAGGSVNLSAYLAPTAQGCIPIAVLITWEVDGATSFLGYLNATAGPHVQFTSFPYGSGLVEVSASGLGVALCGASTQKYQAQTTVLITLLAPMGVSGLEVAPDPALPQEPVTLKVAVQGGIGPYRATFGFGDGTSQTITALDPSGLSTVHDYLTGTYEPSVTVTDALGETGHEAAVGPLLVSPALTVAVSGPATDPEVGLAYPLAANVTGGEPPYALQWNDSEGRTATGTAWDFAPTVPGPDTVTVRVTDALGSSATSSRTILSEPALNVTALAGHPEVDLGHPLPISIAISGGSGPFSVAITALPSGSGLDLSGVPARAFSEALVPTATGQFWAQVSVSDALGAGATVIVPLAQVNPPPRLNLTLARGTVEAGSPVSLVGLASGGSPPYAWALASTESLNSSAPSAGVPAGSALFAWSGTVSGTGMALFELTVTDASGVVVTANASVSVMPALRLTGRATAPNATVNGTDTIEALVSGGAPPYELLFTASDGQSQTMNLSGPAPANWAWTPTHAGTYTVSIDVADDLGRFALSNLSVAVRAGSAAAVPPGIGTPSVLPPSGGGPSAPNSDPSTPSPAPSPAPTPSLTGDFAGGFGAAAGLGLMVLVGWVLLRGRLGRRASGPSGPTSRDLATVGRLLEENEGIDRETLLFLAEGEGLDETAVDRAVRRLKGLGRVTSEPDPDGQESFRTRPRPSTTTPASPPSGDDRPEGLS